MLIVSCQGPEWYFGFFFIQKNSWEQEHDVSVFLDVYSLGWKIQRPQSMVGVSIPPINHV